MLLEDIEMFLNETVKKNVFSQAASLKVVLELILKIDNSQIDNTQSEFYERSGDYELRLYSNNQKNCNLFISILRENVVDIQLNKGGEYLYLQKHEGKEDLDKLDSAVRDILFYPITETLTYCDEKLIKAVYLVNHNFNGSNSQNEYTMSFGSCWPWKKKRTVETTYSPWIDKAYFLTHFR